MIRRPGPIGLLGLLLVAACGGADREDARPGEGTLALSLPNSAPPGPAETVAPVAPPQGSDTTAVGIVRSTGAAPFEQLVLHDSAAGGAGVAIAGPLLQELAHAMGAEVRVRGAALRNVSPTPSRAIGVVEYEILAVNGERPTVGLLALRDSTLVLEGRDTVALTAAPAELSALVGAKLWILGVREGARLRVQGYGVLRGARP